MYICPECKSERVLIERRPNGNTKCMDCNYKASTKTFFEKGCPCPLCGSKSNVFDVDQISGSLTTEKKVSCI